MTQAEDAQPSLEAVREQIFTPETFSPQWNGDPVELLDIPLNFPYSSNEWDALFETFISLLQHPEHQIWRRAIANLIEALGMEQSQHANCDDYQPRPTEQRVRSILAAIAAQAPTTPEIFETFCSGFRFLAQKNFSSAIPKSPYNQLVLEWLDQLAASEDRQIPTQEAILAAQLFFGAYDSTWQEVGEMLLDLLDHADLNVRACAAYQIGKFCGEKYLLDYTTQLLEEFEPANSTDPPVIAEMRETMLHQQAMTAGLPMFEQIMGLIRDKELARPGVAGAFQEFIPNQDFEAKKLLLDLLGNASEPEPYIQELERLRGAGAFWGVLSKQDFDMKEWLLDLLENSPEPEPYIPYFPCNLAFDAHERFSQDADAIRRLIDMGRVDIAIAAATDASCKVAALEPLLIELGHHANPDVVQLASWHLAYFYHSLHPRGAELGYVELVSQLSEIDLFLLFRQEEESESPYAVVIYPKAPNQTLSRAMAQKWVDRIFPEAVRGAPREDLPSFISHWYQRGYFNYHGSDQNPDSTQVEHVTIGYRSQLPWNPKQFF